jgi:hypothetical protein
MLYYLVILLAGPLVTRMGDRSFQPWTLVGVGSTVAGVVLLVPAADATLISVSFAVIVVGLGHAAVRGPQIALALDIAEAEMDHVGRAATLAAMRSLERLGSIVGLLFVALLVARFDLLAAMGTIGLLVAVAGATYLFSHPVLERHVANA